LKRRQVFKFAPDKIINENQEEKTAPDDYSVQFYVEVYIAKFV